MFPCGGPPIDKADLSPLGLTLEYTSISMDLQTSKMSAAIRKGARISDRYSFFYAYQSAMQDRRTLSNLVQAECSSSVRTADSIELCSVRTHAKHSS